MYSISPTVSPTGKYAPHRRPDPRYGRNGGGLDSANNEDDALELFKACARGESIKMRTIPIDRTHYNALLHHPLPPSAMKPMREATLRKCVYLPINERVMGAVILNDAWVVEELYLQGCPCDIPDHNGYTPLMMAAQLNHYDCCTILCHIGTSMGSQIVNMNAVNKQGYSALYVAEAADAIEAIKVLNDYKAKYIVYNPPKLSGGTALDMPRKKMGINDHDSVKSVISLDLHNGMPSRYTEY